MKQHYLLLAMIALVALLLGCAQVQTDTVDAPTDTQLISCSNTDLDFCQEPTQWTCPSEEYFAMCRDRDKFASGVCEQEDKYIQWLIESCPQVGILE